MSNGIEAYLAGNYKHALKLLKPAAEQGNAEAQAMLGTIYQLGLGGADVDVEQALKWYQLASEQGHAVASNNLAGLHAGNPETARQYYALATEQGFEHAPLHVGS